MNKKEINEIKSLYDTIEECGIARLCGCYVNAKKEKVKIFDETFLTLPDEEVYKYLDIFRKTLSGSIGKSLLNLSFVDQMGDDHAYGRGMLYDLYKSELKDDGIVDNFYDAVISAYDHVGNYLILLIFQNYDVPGKGSDGLAMDDASDEVFSYVLCSICPMNLTKPGLGFDDALKEIHTLKQSFFAEAPEAGFLYPAFNDRTTDLSQLLFFTKKADVLQDALFSEVLDVSTMLPAKHQKEGFAELVQEVLGDDADLETVVALHDNLSEYVEEQEEATGEKNIVLDKAQVRGIFENTGIAEGKLRDFDRQFEEKLEALPAPDSNIKLEESVYADNIMPSRSYDIQNADMKLSIRTKRSDIIETRMIDGRKCLVIELTDDLTVNGIPVK